MLGGLVIELAATVSACGTPDVDTVEITDSRESRVGAFRVRRALPQRGRRTVGAWCFVDHVGLATITEERGLDVAPHPHIGLQTVTWLFEGEAVHRDSAPSSSLGSQAEGAFDGVGRGEEQLF